MCRSASVHRCTCAIAAPKCRHDALTYVGAASVKASCHSECMALALGYQQQATALVTGFSRMHATTVYVDLGPEPCATSLARHTHGCSSGAPASLPCQHTATAALQWSSALGSEPVQSPRVLESDTDCSSNQVVIKIIKKKKQIGHHARPRRASATAPRRTGADICKTGSAAGKCAGAKSNPTFGTRA